MITLEVVGGGVLTNNKVSDMNTLVDIICVLTWTLLSSIYPIPAMHSLLVTTKWCLKYGCLTYFSRCSYWFLTIKGQIKVRFNNISNILATCIRIITVFHNFLSFVISRVLLLAAVLWKCLIVSANKLFTSKTKTKMSPGCGSVILRKEKQFVTK